MSDTPSCLPGLSRLQPDGLAQFSGDYVALLLLGLVIVLGNTMYPVALHGVVAAVRASSFGRNDPSLQYLLERPRRVHTHLFPAVQVQCTGML